MTSVGLVGLDYCGSTLVNNIMSGLPRCLGAGETHWIIDGQNNKKNYVDRCRECGGGDCPVFTDVAIERLKRAETLDSNAWWSTISESSGKDIIISGDKRPEHYERLGIPDKLIIVIKDPRAHIVSRAARSLAPEARREYSIGKSKFRITDSDLQGQMRHWTNSTARHITWALESKKEVLCISIESLIDDHEQYLRELAGWIGVEFSPKAIRFWENDLHYIGGNHSVKRLDDKRYFYEKVKKDMRWKKILTQKQQSIIINDPEISHQLSRVEGFSLPGTTFFSS